MATDNKYRLKISAILVDTTVSFVSGEQMDKDDLRSRTCC